MRFLSVDDFISFLSMEDSLIMAIAAEGGNKLSMVLRFSASYKRLVSSMIYQLKQRNATSNGRRAGQRYTFMWIFLKFAQIWVLIITITTSHRRRSSFLGFRCTEYLSKQKLCSCCCFSFFFHSSCGSATIKT